MRGFERSDSGRFYHSGLGILVEAEVLDSEHLLPALDAMMRRKGAIPARMDD